MFRRARHGSFALYASLSLLVACAQEQIEDTPQVQSAIETPSSEPTYASPLMERVATTRAEYELVALGAVIASQDGIIDHAVDGVRARNTADPVQITDKWHLGSNTKALTALLYGQLVERDLAAWGATLPELFPELGETIDPAWQSVTIEDLFAHRTGMKQLGGFWLNARRNDDRTVVEQRRIEAHRTLTAPPSKEVGVFDYNNLNYIIAGAAIENILARDAELPKSWEAAMQSLLFDALSSPEHQLGFGFGPPPTGIEGHRTLFGGFPTAVGRGKSADNPLALGPAGTLHATLDAHAMLAREFLRSDSELIPAYLRDHLWTPYPDAESGYAMGWGVFDHDEFGRVYQHAGSNTMWYSLIVIAPDLDRLVIVNANQFSDGARTAADQIARSLLSETTTAPPEP